MISRRLILAAGLAASLAPARIGAADRDNARHSALLLAFGYSAFGNLALGNTSSDARLMEQRLKALKFGSVVRVVDADPPTLERVLADFVRQLRPGGLAIVWVAGHGAQIEGANFLLLGDGKTFIDMQSIIESVRAGAGAAVFFLDMCRNNPFGKLPADAEAVRAVRRARALVLSNVDAPGDAAGTGFNFTALAKSGEKVSRVGAFELRGTGVRVVFATDPQNVALDYVSEFDSNSPFASAIARRLGERRSLDDAISLATGDVVDATKGAQSPWSQGSLGSLIYLAGQPKPENPSRLPFQVPG